MSIEERCRTGIHMQPAYPTFLVYLKLEAFVNLACFIIFFKLLLLHTTLSEAQKITHQTSMFGLRVWAPGRDCGVRYFTGILYCILYCVHCSGVQRLHPGIRSDWVRQVLHHDGDQQRAGHHTQALQHPLPEDCPQLHT